RHGEAPALVPGAEDAPIGQESVLEEDRGEALVAVEPLDGPNRHPLGVQVDQEVRQASVPLRLGITTEQAEHPVAERASGRPRLLTRKSPTVVRVVAGCA